MKFQHIVNILIFLYIKIFIERSEDKCDYIVGIKCTGLSDAQK